jgi:hypothetical protein
VLYNLASSKVAGRSCLCGHSKCPRLCLGQFPEEYPYWDPNDDRDYQQLEQYQKALLEIMKEGREKAKNMNKTTEVLQGPDESPSQFYEWLCEAFCLYTPFDPEVAKNQSMTNATFVSQVQGDIK